MNYPAPAPPYLGPPKYHSGTDNKASGEHPVDRIVLHGTVTPSAPGWARKVAVWFREGTVRGSAHYVIDPEETFQAAYDSVVCWHAPPNRRSIGIEICDPVVGPITRWDGGYNKAAFERAVKLAAELCLAYNVPARMIGPRALRAGKRGICDHDDVSKAWKQSSHWDLGAFPRRRFARSVRAEIARLQGNLVAAAAEDKKANSRVTRARDLLSVAAKVAKNPRRTRRIKRGLEIIPTH